MTNQENGPSFENNYQNLFINGFLENKECTLTLDTGASKSLIRFNLIDEMKINPRYDSFLETATGERAPIYGEAPVNIQIANEVVKHVFLVADIVDECILGLDFFKIHGIVLDMKQGVAVLGRKKIPFISSCKEIKITTPKDSDYVLPKEIYDLYIRTCDSCEKLNEGEKKSILKLLSDYSDVFSTSGNPYGRTNMVKHEIELSDPHPIKQRSRRIPFVKQQEVKEMLGAMQQEGVIEPSRSPWASPVVLVTKKDGSTRFCVDYRKLNDVTVKDSYPLPRIDDTLDTLSGSKYFSTLDLKSGYWQVEVHPKDKEKTAFIAGSGLWEFNVMPFGLCNAPATFERLMETVLRGLNGRTCFIYLDDIIVVGKSVEQLLSNLGDIFQRLREANLRLNVKKCELVKSRVKFLGHIVSEEGIATDPDKTLAVSEWPIPGDKGEVKSFLGLCSYYKRFVRNFASVASPLFQLTEAKREFKWTPQCQESFSNLKNLLCSAPILAYPQPDQQFIVDTDACNFGLGGVLSQKIGDEEYVIAYHSRTLTKSERNYCVTRKELLAVIDTFKKFHSYLYGRRFVLRSDHSSLRWLLNFKNPEGQMARWLEKLQMYDFESQHRSGKLHGNADALSRRPCKLACDHCVRTERKEGIKVRLTRIDGVASNITEYDQRGDPILGDLYCWKEKGARPTWEEVAGLSPTHKRYWALWDSISIEEGVLVRIWESEDGRSFRTQVLVPQAKVKQVLQAYHDFLSGGHLGVNKTSDKIRERFFWCNYRIDVEEWCKKCDICSSRKGPKTRSRGKMKEYVVGYPFERIAIDVMGPLPTTRSGNKYILVAIDYFSKWPEAYAIPNQEAKTIAETLINNLISRFGTPLELHSDQGRNFESQLFQQVCELLKIHKTRTTPLHPQSDGMVERFNRTLGDHLAKMVDKKQSNWDEFIQLFLMAYRTSIHDSTGQTPSNVVLGRELRLPSDVLFGVNTHEQREMDEYVRDLRKRMDYIHELTRERTKATIERVKEKYNRKINSAGFREGDQVWLYNPQRTKGRSPKLQCSWEGPYRIIKRINDLVYRIQRNPRTKFKVVHLDRLAKYNGTVQEELS